MLYNSLTHLTTDKNCYLNLSCHIQFSIDDGSKSINATSLKKKRLKWVIRAWSGWWNSPTQQLHTLLHFQYCCSEVPVVLIFPPKYLKLYKSKHVSLSVLEINSQSQYFYNLFKLYFLLYKLHCFISKCFTSISLRGITFKYLLSCAKEEGLLHRIYQFQKTDLN